MSDEFFEYSKLPVKKEAQERYIEDPMGGTFAVYGKTGDKDSEGRELGVKIFCDIEDTHGSLQSKAEHRTEQNKILSEYFGQNIAKYYGAAIVDAPKRELRRRSEMWMTEEVLSHVPEEEPALMETWEHVQGKNAYSEIVRENLAANPEYQNQAQEFSTKAARLLFEKGLMVDLGHTNALRTDDDILFAVENVGQLADYRRRKEEGQRINFAPNNLIFTNEKKLVLIDTYPTWDYPSSSISADLVKGVAEDDYAVLVDYSDGQGDFSKLEYTKSYGDLNREQKKQLRFMMVNYLTLLKDMGADLEKVFNQSQENKDN